MARFKNNKLQYIFELYDQFPPERRGSGLSRYYFNGLEFPNKENLKPDHDTFAYAAWSAGHKLAKTREKAKIDD